VLADKVRPVHPKHVDMKFIRIVVIIGACSLLFSCKQNNDLSGTWIGAYHFVPNSSFGSKFHLNLLVEVSDDELKVSTLRLDGVHAPKRFTSLKYRRKGDQILIYFDNKLDSIAIVSTNVDSIVLQYHEEGESKFVFKKFTRGTSPTMPTLSGKSFHIFSANYSDSISFITDSMFINISRDAVRGKRWALTTVHDYRFLLIGDYGPPLYVKSIKNDTVTLENFGGGDKYISLVTLNDKNLSLEGHWEEVGRIYNKDYIPLRDRGKMKLTFGADSCEISYGDRVINRRWRLNSTAEILFFDPIGKDNDREWVWYVEKAGDSLIIDRRILYKDVEDEFDSGEKIIFKRK
jgi:hypothetical protein